MFSADQRLSSTVGVGNSGKKLSKAQFAQRVRREREREREREIKHCSQSSMNKQAAVQCTRSGVMPQVPNNSLSNMINRFKRAAAEYARRDMEMKALLGLQSVSSNVPSVVKRHRIQSCHDQASVDMGAANVIGKSLASGSYTEVNKRRDKEIFEPVNKAPMVSPLPTTTLNKKIYISKSAAAQRARRERERQARANLQMPSSIISNGQLGYLPPSTHVVHPHPIQHSDDQVASDPGLAKVIGVNLATPPVAEPNQKQGDKETNASIVKTSSVCPIPAKSLSLKVYTSKRMLAQRARREQERQAQAHMQISSSISRDAATKTSEHPCPIQPSNPQVTSNVEVDNMVVENSANRAEPKPTEGDIQIISPLVKAPLPATSISKKINISKRITAQRARREREKQYLLRSQVPSQISSNERSTHFPARECSNNPYQIQPSDDQVTINVEVAKVVGDNLTNGSKLKQTEGNTETISPLAKAPMVSSVPAASSCKKIYISKRKAAQRARREKEKQDRLHSQLPTQISSNEQPAPFPAKECSNNPCPIQPSDAQVIINVEVAKVFGGNSANRADPKQTERDTDIISPLVKAPIVSPLPASSSSKEINISKRTAAQRARREREKQYLLQSQLPSQISSNERSTYFPATECSNNPCPIQPTDDQVTVNVEVAKAVREGLANRAEPKQTEGDTDIASPLVKAPMVSPLPAASSSKEINISKRIASQRARRKREKQYVLQSQMPSQISSNERSTFFPSTECSNNPRPIQPSDDQVTVNVEVAKVVREGLANRAESKQSEGGTEVMFPLVKAPTISSVPVASSSKMINISKRTAAHRARRVKEKLDQLHSQTPSQITRNEESTSVPATEFSKNPRPIQPSDNQVTVNLDVAKPVGANLASRPLTEPKQTEGDRETISLIVEAPSISPTPASSFSKMINTSRHAAAQHTRWDTEKQVQLNTDIPLLISSNKESISSPVTGHSGNTRLIKLSDAQGTVNAEVAGAINENSVNLAFKDPKQMQGHKQIISPLVKAPMVTPVSDAFFREVINTSKRAATHHARKDKMKLARVELQVPSSALSEKQSVSFTEPSENHCSTQPSNGQATVDLEVSKVVGDYLADRPFLEALRARVASKIRSYSLSNERRASMRGTEHMEHTHFVQVSNDQVNVNLEVAKVATGNSENRPFTEPKQKEGDTEIVSPLLGTRIPRPWLQQRRILSTTVASSDQLRPSFHASSHQLRSSPPKQSFDSVRASSHQLRSLPPKQSFDSVCASMGSLPSKESVAPVHASCLKVGSSPPEQKSASHHKPMKWSIASSSPVRTEFRTNGLTKQKLPVWRKA